MDEFTLKVWRVHPHGIKIVPADASLHGEAHPAALKYCGPYTHANKFGFWIFPPADLDIVWRGAGEFEYHILSEWPDEEISVVRSLVKADDPLEGKLFMESFRGRRKVECGVVDDNICSVWTGCIFETPPGWALHIRSPINTNLHAPYRIQEGILETDWMRYDIWINVAVLRQDTVVSLRRDQWPPMAQLVPVRRESYDSQWILSEERINRESESGNRVYLDWADYNYKKFVHLSPEKPKDSSTYFRERSRILLGRNVPEPSRSQGRTSTEPKGFDQLVPALLADGGLFEEAQAVLHKSVERDPDNLQALRLLAHVYRGQGKLQSALQSYRRILDLKPDDRMARYLCAILNREEPTSVLGMEEPRPAPFVLVDDFLSHREHDEIVDLAYGSQHELAASTTDDNRHRPDVRFSWQVFPNKIEHLLPWFTSRIRSTVGDVARRLCMPCLCAGRIEAEMTLHRPGGFYQIHRDNSGEKIRGRQISYAYYFYRKPKKFSGGDLLLYDTDLPRAQCLPAFTRIVPKDNTIVFFPSAFCHQVTTVTGDVDDFREGRFALNGWIRDETCAETAAECSKS